jgi:hypothetical protein
MRLRLANGFGGRPGGLVGVSVEGIGRQQKVQSRPEKESGDGLCTSCHSLIVSNGIEIRLSQSALTIV